MTKRAWVLGSLAVGLAAAALIWRSFGGGADRPADLAAGPEPAALNAEAGAIDLGLAATRESGGATAWDQDPSGRETLAAPVEAPERLLEGRVVERGTGRPIAGAEVRTQRDTAVTDADGRFEVPWTEYAGTTTDLHVRAEWFLDVEHRAAWGADPVVIEVERGGEIRGRLLRAGAPLERLLVTLGGPGDAVMALTGPDGSYRLGPLRPSQAKRRLETMLGNGTKHFLEIPLTPPAGQTLWLDFLLPIESSFAGHVRVNAEPSASLVRWTSERASGSAQADANGRYVADGVPVGVIEARVVVADAPLLAKLSGDVRTVDVLLRQTLVDFEVTVPKTMTIEGVVLAADGSPLAGMGVSLHGDDGSAAPKLTDGRGRFRLEVPEGTVWWLMAGSGPEYALLTGVVAGTTDVVLQLGSMEPFTVVVTDPSGQPLEDCRFLLLDLEGGERAEFVSFYDSKTPSAPEPGRYDFELWSKSFQLIVTSDGRIPWTSPPLNARAGSVSVTLRSGASVRVEPAPGVDLPPGGPFALIASQHARALRDPNALDPHAQAALAGQRIEIGGKAYRGLAPGDYVLFDPKREIAFEPDRIRVPASALDEPEPMRVTVRWRRVP